MYGRVSYFHAGGIDKPLLITKEGAESVVPREMWRGQFHAGTSPSNGAVRDCTQGGQTGCLLIAWPGWKTSASHSWGSDAPDIDVWYGGLVDGMRDASGQMYMRNRYYDPATGQFTQTDPIGIAGGLNAYGFAAGDPVSYSDPYGLCPKHLRRGPNRDRCPGGMDTLQYQEAERAIHLLDPEAREGLMDMLVNGDIRLRGKIDNGTPAGSPGGHIEVTAAFFGTTERGFQTTGAGGDRGMRGGTRGCRRCGALLKPAEWRPRSHSGPAAGAPDVVQSHWRRRSSPSTGRTDDLHPDRSVGSKCGLQDLG